VSHNLGVTIPESLHPAAASGESSAFRPAAMCHGPGHVVRYGNPAFTATFGPGCLGMPARECLVALPPDAFQLLDAVLEQGRAWSRWVRLGTQEWRMTAAPRIDPGTGEAYGVAFLLRARDDRAGDETAG
jgi:hypothetical protein